MKEQDEKQAIEEMARIIHGTPFSDMHRAVALYNAGYRKQSAGEWKAQKSICFDYICTNCCEGAITYEDQYYTERYHLTKYCPNCGARMKGGEE